MPVAVQPLKFVYWLDADSASSSDPICPEGIGVVTALYPSVMREEDGGSMEFGLPGIKMSGIGTFAGDGKFDAELQINDLERAA